MNELTIECMMNPTLYDKYKTQDAIKFILTGSAHLDLHEKSAETLAGRVQFYRLREFKRKLLNLLQ